MEELAGPRPLIFDYQDYRLFIKDWIQFKRISDPAYNLKKMAKALGFASHSGLAMILCGSRELKNPYLEACSRHLKLDMAERLYLESMVRSGTLSPTKKRALLREVRLLAKTFTPPELDEGIRILDYGLVHQILCLSRRLMTVEEIRASFRYPIKAEQILAILEFMLERKQVIGYDGRFKVQEDALVAKDEMPSAPIQQLHRDALGLAAQALRDPLESREFQTYLLTVEKKKIPEIKKKIKELVSHVIREYEADLDADQVIQFHFHMFEPLQKAASEKK